MALHVHPAKDYPDDPGIWEHLYPVPEDKDLGVMMYDKTTQRTSLLLANIVGAFDDWIKSFFEPNYFKFCRIRTSSAMNEYRSFMKQIYKKEKPFLVIDPQSIDLDTDSIFTQNMLGRYNMYDPKNENIGSQLIYSLELAKSEQFELVFRRNRYMFDFAILIMEQTLDRQLSTYNKMLMNIRHNSKFLLTRTIPFMIPTNQIQIIASLYNMDWKSDEFLTYMNSVSRYPIIKRVQPNGNVMYFMEQEINIQVEVPNYPNKDTPETSNAIDWGARITDDFLLRADIPAEFILMIPAEYYTSHQRPADTIDDEKDITVISPVYADMDWPTEIDGYRLCNRVDIQVTDIEDKSLELIPVLKSYDPKIWEIITEFVMRGQKLDDLMRVRVYPNGSMIETSFVFDNHGILTLNNPEIDKLYTANIYLNLKTINTIREGKAIEHIGTIEKY